MITRALVAMLIAFAPAIALAGPATGRIPEPETLALLGAGVVALLLAKYRK